ncbi:MAG: methionyl-tRNA formyltransferase [Parcubacteria group bacterium Gr01-1014_73]|nr:MAG: methionyl-tRNA formyltransferase [Parcubacteria group bacterium Gr01-1014_73]
MKINFAFFGTDNFSVGVLDELKKASLPDGQAGLLPKIIITTPDKPKGRGLKLTPPPVKLWALTNKIDFVQPEKLDNEFILGIRNLELEIGVVASYGKIISKNILEIPKRGMLNVHPSLLPKYRGASPIQVQILNDEKNIGVTLILMDEKMDHGPILASREFSIYNFQFSNESLTAKELSKKLAAEGGKLLAETLPKWLAGEIKPIPQDESRATFCPKIFKENGLIDLNVNPRQNFLKIQAFVGWPSAYFFAERKGKKIRVKITRASFANGQLKIESVIPEGKKEMPFSKFNAYKTDATTP